MSTDFFRVSRVNLKPMLGDPFKGIDPHRALNLLQRTLLKQIREKLMQTAFSLRARKSLSKALSLKVGDSSLTVIANHPAWGPLVKGQKKGPMTWLQKAKGPIPIVTETGEVIFRSANAKTMKNGAWVHPGRGPTNFIEKAKKEAREAVRTRLLRDLTKQIQATWSRK